MNEFIEYMKLHLISLEQDFESIDTEVSINDYAEYPSLDLIEGQIIATRHLLAIAEEYNFG